LRRNTGFVDRNGKRLFEGDKVTYLYPFVKSWIKAKIIFKDDIPRVAHLYAEEIINVDIARDIKKASKQYVKMSLGKGEEKILRR